MNHALIILNVLKINVKMSLMIQTIIKHITIMTVATFNSQYTNGIFIFSYYLSLRKCTFLV